MFDSLNTGRRPRPKIPSMAEYATAQRKFKIGIDKGSEEGDDTIIELVLNPAEYPELYWQTIPENEKRKISVGKQHDGKYRYSVSKLS